MTDNQIKKLTNFLKKKDVYKSYMRNVKEYQNMSVKRLLKRLNHFRSVFTSSFVWARTIEGHEFWFEIDNDWQYECG